MSQNKNALIRYKTIDKCLQNRYREWTLEDLIESCSDALYEFEGKTVNVSKRSIQLDIQIMRSNKLGYNAPIIVYDKKFYTYETEDYSITNIPITGSDMNILSETVAILKQFKDFSIFSELGGIIHKLEDKIYSEGLNQDTIIHLDKNENLKGLEYLDLLYQAILKKVCLDIHYQSFNARSPSNVPFHPYILKEFNNRWFLVGKNDVSDKLLTLALDRMIAIKYNLELEYKNKDFDSDDYYKHTIGVTVLNENNLKLVRLKVNRSNAPYVITKPLHNSQKLIEKLKDGSIVVEIKVHLNFELERLVLGFGESIEVLRPKRLRGRIHKNLINATNNYID